MQGLCWSSPLQSLQYENFKPGSPVTGLSCKMTDTANIGSQSQNRAMVSSLVS